MKPRRGAKADRATKAGWSTAADAEQRAAKTDREHATVPDQAQIAQAQKERTAQTEPERAEAERERQRIAQAEQEHAGAQRAAHAEQVASDDQDQNGAAAEVKSDASAEPDGDVSEDAAKGAHGIWLPEDYFRPLSAPRSPAERRAQLLKQAQEEKEAQWDEQVPWDEQAPLRGPAQPEKKAKAQPDILNAERGHSRSTSTLAAAVVAAVIAGSVGLALALRSSPENTHGSRPLSLTEIRSQATTWVAQQVSHDTAVSCDHVMCTALAQHHFPAANLHVLSSTSTNPAGSTVIIATPTIRSQFGSSLGSSLAPVVLAEFGTGRSQIDIRLVAPHGARSYRHELAGDVLARKTSGSELLSNPRIHASAAARKQLTAGQVDPRLLIVIAVMAAQEPVDILEFSDSGPHASTGIPMRVAELAETSGTAPPAWTRAMLALLQTQTNQFHPAQEGTVSRAGNTVLYVKFPAPTPLGLLGPTGP
jgi:hypothetical protein